MYYIGGPESEFEQLRSNSLLKTPNSGGGEGGGIRTRRGSPNSSYPMDNGTHGTRLALGFNTKSCRSSLRAKLHRLAHLLEGTYDDTSVECSS